MCIRDSFYCNRIFDAEKIHEWIDDENGQTAVCPFCGIDSVIPCLLYTSASLPLHLYRYTDKGKERVFDHPLYHILHDEPNEEMTSFVFREVLMSHLLIWGNAYAQIIRCLLYTSRCV